MKNIVITLALVLAAVPAKASVSSIGFDLIPPLLASANPSGDINSAITFTFTDLGSTNNTSGIFAGLPRQDFGSITFDPSIGTSLVLRSPEFGVFASTTIETVTNFSGFLNLLVDGTWSPGTSEHGVMPSDADLRLGLTQTPPTDGQISVSGTMSTTAVTVVPEPPTVLLFLGGIIGIVLAASRLKKVVS